MHPPLSASQVYNGLCDITMYRGGIVISRTLGILNLLALGALAPGLGAGIGFWNLGISQGSGKVALRKRLVNTMSSASANFCPQSPSNEA